jgi:hypothetical protein
MDSEVKTPQVRVQWFNSLSNLEDYAVVPSKNITLQYESSLVGVKRQIG